ncbi:MAG: bile acid:sodium symporter family protein [Halieaceae bacterium]
MTLSLLESLLMPLSLCLLMLGMGATLTPDHFRVIARRPLPVLIGLASQYGWMPLIAVALALGLQLTPATAVGLIILGCSAGGALSNFFCYLGRGDLALSISMTVVSTLTGLVMIPLMLFVYATPFLDASSDPELNIPLGKVFVTLLVVLIPVGLGLLLRHHSLYWARRAEIAGTVVGLLLVFVIVGSNVLREFDAILMMDLSVYLASVLMGPIGFFLGYLGARLMKLNSAQKKAVSLETGLQNIPLALAIILISFPGEIQHEVLVVPVFYGIAITPLALLGSWLFRSLEPTVHEGAS